MKQLKLSVFVFFLVATSYAQTTTIVFGEKTHGTGFLLAFADYSDAFAIY